MLVLSDSDLSTMMTSSESSPMPVSSQVPGGQSLTPEACQDYVYSPSASTSAQHHLHHSGAACVPLSPPGIQQSHQWDINDVALPLTDSYDAFELWPSGHYRRVYRGDSDDARRHVSGWAMRNTNNHNALILKKSCLGVLVCSLDCLLDSGKKVNLRPAICDKARRKQIGKPCPNPGCTGKLTLLSCRGHCGYPVTHFWRHVNNAVYFQAKGYHDHPRPEAKSLTDKGRHSFSKRPSKEGDRVLSALSKRRFPILTTDDIHDRKHFHPDEEEVMCSCPPFECVCPKSARHKHSLVPSAFGYFRDTTCAATFLPYRAHAGLGTGVEQLSNRSFTQINITNTCLPNSALDVSIPNIEIYKNCSKLDSRSCCFDNEMKMVRYGNTEEFHSLTPHNHEPHNHEPHNREPHNHGPHNREPHNHGPHNREPHNHEPHNHGPHSQNVNKIRTDDFRPSHFLNFCSSTGHQHVNCGPQNFSSAAGVPDAGVPDAGVPAADVPDAPTYAGDETDDYSKHRTGQCYSRNRGLADGGFEILGLQLKTEPCENVHNDNLLPDRGDESHKFHHDPLYNPASPAFSTHPVLSPACPTELDRSFEAAVKDREGQDEPTYITLTSPPRQEHSSQGRREYHSCRLVHLNRSPIAISLDNVLYPPPPTQPAHTDTNSTPPVPVTPVPARHQDNGGTAGSLISNSSQQLSPNMPRLILHDEHMNSHGRSTHRYPAFSSYHDSAAGSVSLGSDRHVAPHPHGSATCGGNPSVPYGFYCNDVFGGTSQQQFRNHSINITFTYN